MFLGLHSSTTGYLPGNWKRLHHSMEIHTYPELTSPRTNAESDGRRLCLKSTKVICKKEKLKTKPHTQMHLQSVSKGSCNETSCSFTAPVFFKWRQARTASSCLSRNRVCVPILWWPAGLSKLTEMNLPAEGWACSAVLLRRAHTRADIKLFQEVISLLFFTKTPNGLDLMHTSVLSVLDRLVPIKRKKLNKRNEHQLFRKERTWLTLYKYCRTSKSPFYMQIGYSEQREGVNFNKNVTAYEMLTGPQLLYRMKESHHPSTFHCS